MPANNNKIQTNIKYLMQQHGIHSVTELASKISMQQSTLHRLIAGEVRDPKFSTLKHMAEFFNVSVIDLVESDMPMASPQTIVNEDSYPYNLAFKNIPVIGAIKLGQGEYWSEIEETTRLMNGYIYWPSYDAQAYAIKCEGDLMMPRIKEGEYIIIEPNYHYKPGDEVLIITNEHKMTVKTFLFERNDFYHLLPINENNEPIRLEKAKIHQIQYVAGIAKPSLWREK